MYIIKERERNMSWTNNASNKERAEAESNRYWIENSPNTWFSSNSFEEDIRQNALKKKKSSKAKAFNTSSSSDGIDPFIVTVIEDYKREKELCEQKSLYFDLSALYPRLGCSLIAFLITKSIFTNGFLQIIPYSFLIEFVFILYIVIKEKTLKKKRQIK